MRRNPRVPVALALGYSLVFGVVLIGFGALGAVAFLLGQGGA